MDVLIYTITISLPLSLTFLVITLQVCDLSFQSVIDVLIFLDLRCDITVLLFVCRLLSRIAEIQNHITGITFVIHQSFLKMAPRFSIPPLLRVAFAEFIGTYVLVVSTSSISFDSVILLFMIFRSR